MSDLLSRVYIAAGHYNEAMRLHEDILRLIVDGDDSDDKTIDTVSAKRASEEIAMLKQCYLRRKGWDKKPEVYKELVDQTLAMPVYKNDPAFKPLQKFESWTLKEKPDGDKDFKPVVKWMLIEVQNEKNKGKAVNGKNSRMSLRRITSNWGMNPHLLTHDSGHSPIGNLSAGYHEHQPEIFV